MAKKLSVQEIILTLQNYWSNQGCLLLQAYDTEKGAGTMSPYTFLRAIGPEPWNAAYVEPSRRPADGRYGENPSLGCAGLGWEVWLDGMEVTQFTYFQQVGGLECHPVTSEITYGLERLASYIQEVESVYDLVWTGDVKYGDIFTQPEYEHSKYAFEESNAELLMQLFTDFEKEATVLMEKGLVHPAYDYVLKCSHAFNLMDARGIISATDRAGFLGRIRKMARTIAKTFVAEREALGFPLLKEK